MKPEYLYNASKKKMFLFRPLIMCVIHIFLIGFLVASLIFEMCTGQSMLGNFGATCPLFFQAPVILEIIKILGFSTVLIGWIQSGLDKCVLGLTRDEILTSSFRWYRVFSFTHIFWTLSCIATSVASMSESALISIIAVLYGIAYQWTVLINIVIDSQKCEEWAAYAWTEELKKTQNRKANLLRLAHSFPKYDSSHYTKHQQCFSYALLIEDNSSFLRELNDVWQVYLESSSVTNNIQAAENIFSELCAVNCDASEKSQREKDLCAIACGYLIYQINKIKSTASLLNNEQTMILLSQQIAALTYNLRLKAPAEQMSMRKVVCNCLLTNFYILVWVFFQVRSIQLSHELLRVVPELKNSSFAIETAHILVPQIANDLLRSYVQIGEAQLDCQLARR